MGREKRITSLTFNQLKEQSVNQKQKVFCAITGFDPLSNFFHTQNDEIVLMAKNEDPILVDLLGDVPIFENNQYTSNTLKIADLATVAKSLIAYCKAQDRSDMEEIFSLLED